MQYKQYNFHTTDELERNWLISILSDYHFEGFEETTDTLKAFVPEQKVRPLLIKEILHDNELGHISYNEETIEEKNWNEEWERNFEPVTIAKRVGIRAPFHDALNTEIELVIEPKMSFGTGHHATTAGMTELMLDIDFTNKQVLDFGSGTGVLAILAEKLGATEVLAIDNEEWAYRNCLENIFTNNCTHIIAQLANSPAHIHKQYDILLANINRHIILQFLPDWKKILKPGGKLLLSGILLSDEQDILNAARVQQLRPEKIIRNNGWLAMQLH